MFIFGWGRRTVDDLGPTLPGVCPNCSNQVWFRLQAHKTWISVYFAPVLAYDKAVALICPVCSRGLRLKGEQISKALSLNGLALSLASHEIPENTFRLAADKLRLLPAIDGSRNLESEIGSVPPPAVSQRTREVRISKAPVPVFKLVLVAAAFLAMTAAILWMSYGSTSR